jgi:hypothetical protein
MAKPMRIMVEVEEIAHGRVFRMLDGTPGVVSITPVGDGPKSSRPDVAQKKGGAQSVACLILGALVKTPGISRAQLAPVLESAGKKVSSMPDALAKLRKAKHITTRGKGKTVVYSITPAGKKHFDTACEIQPAKE